MKQQTIILKITMLSAFAGIFLSSCAPTAQQLKGVIEKDPSIVFSAIEKAPDKFIEVVMKAQQEAQKVAGERAQQEEKKQRDEEFKNPLKPEIDETRVIFGNKSAPVTIVEFSDFQCPYCARGHQTINDVLKTYGDKVRVVFKHLPLDFHPQAMPAARYFEAIAQQDHAKAQKFHDIVFENQDKLRGNAEVFFKDSAKKVGADLKKIEVALKNDSAITKRIETDMAEAKKFGFSGTPGFIINGVSLKGAYPIDSFKEIIDRHLSDKK